MRQVKTVWTCDRCEWTSTEYGAKEHPPFGWDTSTLEVVGAGGMSARKRPLLCKSCRESLSVWPNMGVGR